MTQGDDNLEFRQLSTEQSRHELSELDLLSAKQLVSLMCTDAHRVPRAVAAAESAITRAVEGVVERLERGGRLIYVGAGTAGRLGMLDAAEAGPTFNVPDGQVIGVLAGGNDAFDIPIENAEDDRDGGAAAVNALEITDDDVVVGIAASGRTPYVLGAITAANEAGALTIGLACNSATRLAASSQIAIEVLVGPEIVAGSTRLNAGTAQKIVLNIISTASMVQLGKTYGGLMVDLRATNDKLRARATNIVAEIADVTSERARDALERCDWKPKIAATMLLGQIDAERAERALDRHRGRLRPALAELTPGAGVSRIAHGDAKRLGVAAAYVGGELVRGDVSISGDEITAIGLSGSGTGLAIPALVDAQVNGYANVDILSTDDGGLAYVGEALLRDGVGAYQPTLISADEADLVRALERIAAHKPVPGRQAQILGVHLEGPFLSPARAGAHRVEHLRTPNPELLERLLASGPVRMVTLAPELAGALELIEICRTHGVVVSLGHSEASATQAQAAFAAGARAVTHIFNAMPPPSARVPGLAGAALSTPGVDVQLIADGVHVSDEMIRIAFSAAPGRCSLVSDTIAAARHGDGQYRLGAVDVEVDGGVARRADGTLAGSTTSLADGLANLARLSLDRCVAIASTTERPARLLGASDVGRLEPGRQANMLIVDDQLSIQRVIALGRELEPPVPAKSF